MFIPAHLPRRKKAWQELGDSNPRPSVLETDALPTELNSCACGGVTARGGKDQDAVWEKRRVDDGRESACRAWSG